MGELHVQWNDTGASDLPTWVSRLLRAASSADPVLDALTALKGLFMTQLDDLKAGIAANSAAASAISAKTDGVLASVNAVRDRVAALPGVPPDLTAELDAVAGTLASLNDATTDLDTATTELDAVAVATPEPPPVEPPVEPPAEPPVEPPAEPTP